MRNLEDVTEEEIKTAFENTPVLCEHFTWEQVQDNTMLIITLKNQVIAKEEHKMEIQTGSNVFVLPVVARMPLIAHTPLPAPAPASKKEIRRSTITLDEKQIGKVLNAVVLSRNCLMSFSLGDALRSEALADLAEAQKILKSFFEPRA